jgi:hypothetical protein
MGDNMKKFCGLHDCPVSVLPTLACKAIWGVEITKKESKHRDSIDFTDAAATIFQWTRNSCQYRDQLSIPGNRQYFQHLL